MRNSKRAYPVLFLLLICCISFIGCDIINPSESLPTRIELQPFDFQVEPGQGSAQNKITEIWVFYGNNTFLGAFTPPVAVNFLDEGPTHFKFRPGIRNNGILDDAITYPMFEEYAIDINASSGSVATVSPVTRYKPEVVFSFLSDFELDNPWVDNRDTVSASNLVRSTTNPFEGDYCGEIIMSASANFIEVGHILPIGGLPVDGMKATYLEFRYKSEVDMGIGLLGYNLTGQSFSKFFYLVKASDDWNMLYIDLTDQLELSKLDAYKILFQSIYPENSTEPEYHIFLDNIKVVHL
jgi:hypothetical protein